MMHRSTFETPDLGLMLGRLLERSEATLERLDRIDSRLEAGDTRMDEITSRIAAIEAIEERREEAQDAPKRPVLPIAETVIKAAAPYLIALLTLWLTGSAESALKLLAAASSGK
ncbi:MAG TPA: hypothetical protein PK264_21355 [Hyphomicrobiaceae bacterium]|nr:hypothetical protein [Hyphomicrobiaceae bacterium]